MNPTFGTGQYLIIDELSYHFSNPQRGEVVIFRYPLNTSEFFIKRVIGLPGETVTIENGKVYITGADKIEHALQEPYIINLGNGANRSVTLGADQYFVMGDNRPDSSDSRVWGPVPRTDVVGRAFVRLLPFTAISVWPGVSNNMLSSADSTPSTNTQ